MSIGVTDTLSRGLKLTLSTAGMKLIALTTVLSFLAVQVAYGMIITILENQEETATAVEPMPFDSLFGSMDPMIGVILIFLLSIGGLMINMATYRTFVAGELENLDPSDFTRNFPLVFLNLLVGGFLIGLLTGIGYMLFIVPGLFLTVSFIFFDLFIIVEDKNFIDAAKSSWDLGSGKRFTLFAIGLVVFFVLWISQFFGILFGTSVFGQAIIALLGAIGVTFRNGAVVGAYEQLTEEPDEPAVTV